MHAASASWKNTRQQAAIARMCGLHDEGKNIRQIIEALTQEGHPPQRGRERGTINSAWRIPPAAWQVNIPRERPRIETAATPPS